MFEIYSNYVMNLLLFNDLALFGKTFEICTQNLTIQTAPFIRSCRLQCKVMITCSCMYTNKLWKLALHDVISLINLCCMYVAQKGCDHLHVAIYNYQQTWNLPLVGNIPAMWNIALYVCLARAICIVLYIPSSSTSTWVTFRRQH